MLFVITGCAVTKNAVFVVFGGLLSHANVHKQVIIKREKIQGQIWV